MSDLNKLMDSVDSMVECPKTKTFAYPAIIYTESVDNMNNPYIYIQIPDLAHISNGFGLKETYNNAKRDLSAALQAGYDLGGLDGMFGKSKSMSLPSESMEQAKAKDKMLNFEVLMECMIPLTIKL